MCIGVFVCMYVFAVHACLVPHRSQKSELDSLKLELQMVVSCHMGCGNQIWNVSQVLLISRSSLSSINVQISESYQAMHCRAQYLLPISLTPSQTHAIMEVKSLLFQPRSSTHRNISAPDDRFLYKLNLCK